MKLIVVDRTKLQAYQRILGQFASEPNVKVLLDRRIKQIRKSREQYTPERRREERRRLIKPLQGRDYIVVHLAGGPPV